MQSLLWRPEKHYCSWLGGDLYLRSHSGRLAQIHNDSIELLHLQVNDELLQLSSVQKLYGCMKKTEDI